MDEIGHRLGLGKVDAAIEEGALGELARLRQTRASGQNRR